MKLLQLILAGLSLMAIPVFSADLVNQSQSLANNAGTFLNQSGIVSKIKSHIIKNKYTYGIVTFIGVAAGGYALYKSLFVSSKKEISYLKEFISPDGKHHLIPIPGLTHLGLRGGSTHYVGKCKSQPELDEVVECDSFLDIAQNEYYTKETFKSLISNAAAQNKPYLLVRLAFFNKDIIKLGYRCKGRDVPYYQYYDKKDMTHLKTILKKLHLK